MKIKVIVFDLDDTLYDEIEYVKSCFKEVSNYFSYKFKIDKNLFVMENAFAGNATYVFKDDWINISQLTKAQILKENLQEDRLIHKKNWKRLITEKLG